MEWLWLLLGGLALGLMWLIIMGLEKMVQIVKTRDDERRLASEELETKIDNEERNFMRVQQAKEYFENEIGTEEPVAGHVPQAFKDAVSVLSSEELLDAMVQKTFGTNRTSEKITADQSAFAPQPNKVAVAGGEGVMPVKAKPSTKSKLSKEEQKIYQKIKQGG